MHDLLTLFDLPTLGSLPQLSNRIRDLDPIWEVTTKSSCRIDGGWKGEIDALLAKLLGALEELFSWRRDQLPKKQQITVSQVASDWSMQTTLRRCSGNRTPNVG